jgi:hypothetical protein
MNQTIKNAREVARLAAALAAATASAGASAAIADLNQFRTAYFNQTSDANSGGDLVPAGYFFNTGGMSENSGDYDDGFFQSPETGSQTYGFTFAADGSTFIYSSPLYNTESGMNAAFPLGGTYHYALSLGGTTQTEVDVPVPGDTFYPASLPYLAGTNYSALQGMNPANAFTFAFSPYAVGGTTVDESLIFFHIHDQTADQDVLATMLPSSTSDYLLPAGTLAAGHSFYYELIFSNRRTFPVEGVNNPVYDIFDNRTQGTFFTAATPVPLPAAIWTFLPALAALGGWRRRT